MVEATLGIWVEFTAYTLKFQELDRGTTGLSLALDMRSWAICPETGAVFRVDSEFIKKEWIAEP